MVSTPRRRASTTPRRTQSPRAPRAARTKSPAKAAKTASPASIPANAPATPVAVTSDNHSTAHEPIVYCYDSTKLHDFEQLPRWMQDNDFIRTGYRVHYAYRTCIASIFRLHNETTNIWTHLLGTLIALTLVWHVIFTPHPVGFSSLQQRFAHLPERPHTSEEFLHVFPANASEDPLLDLNTTATDYASRGIAHRALTALTHVHLPTLAEISTEINAARDSLGTAAHRAADDMEKGVQDLKAALAEWCPSCPYPFQKIEAARSSLSASFETLRESVQDTHAYRSLKSTVERAQLSAKNTRIVLRQIRLVSGGLGLGAINSAPGEGLPTWPITVFLFTAVCALACSTAMHTFMCRDHHTCNFFNRVDFAGISGLIVGSAVPTVYFGMYCSTEWVLFYLCGFLVLNVSTTLIMLSDAMMKPAYRHLRAAVFMMGGGFGILPVVHFVFLEDVPPVLPQLWAEMFFYALGAILFAKRFPECKWPGAFDYFLSSHNWLHICVLIACALHYNLTIEMYEWRQTQICPA